MNWKFILLTTFTLVGCAINAEDTFSRELIQYYAPELKLEKMSYEDLCWLTPGFCVLKRKQLINQLKSLQKRNGSITEDALLQEIAKLYTDNHAQLLPQLIGRDSVAPFLLQYAVKHPINSIEWATRKPRAVAKLCGSTVKSCSNLACTAAKNTPGALLTAAKATPGASLWAVGKSCKLIGNMPRFGKYMITRMPGDVCEFCYEVKQRTEPGWKMRALKYTIKFPSRYVRWSYYICKAGILNRNSYGIPAESKAVRAEAILAPLFIGPVICCVEFIGHALEARPLPEARF